MTTAEKAAYLKGLMEGMELNTDSGEGKLFSVIADILSDLAADVEDLEGDLYDLSEDVDHISDDLSDVEDLLKEDDWEAGDEEDEEPQFFEVTCPACNNTITVDEDVLGLGRVQCPNCGEMMEFDLEDIDSSDSDDGDGVK